MRGLLTADGMASSALRRDRRVFPYGMYLPTRTLVCEHRGESLLGADASAISTWPSFSRPYASPIGVAGSGDWGLTQGNATNQPIVKTNILSGYPVARFDGVDNFLNYPNTGSGMSTFTYFAVIKLGDTGNNTIFAGGNNSAQIQCASGQVYLVKVATSILGNSTAALDTTNFWTICVAYNKNLASGNLDFYINGALDTTVNVTTDLSVGNLFMGGRNSGTTEPFLGDIAHDAFYYSKLTVLEIARANHVLRSLYKHY